MSITYEGTLKKVSRAAFCTASVMLMILSLGLIFYGVFNLLFTLLTSWHEGRDALLLAISYVVIAIAVFDVAKYFMEEEVIQSRAKVSPLEARLSLTKFITTIIIAVFIEGLVAVFEVSREHIQQIFYPIGLLVTATVVVLSLAVYQRISVDTENQESRTVVRSK